jgi:hypothetical protein
LFFGALANQVDGIFAHDFPFFHQILYRSVGNIGVFHPEVLIKPREGGPVVAHEPQCPVGEHPFSIGKVDEDLFDIPFSFCVSITAHFFRQIREQLSCFPESLSEQACC